MTLSEKICRIRSECLVLKKLAESASLPTLAYLLDMAALEAVNHEMGLQRGEPPTRSLPAPQRKMSAVA